jgi:hypothetical protein
MASKTIPQLTAVTTPADDDLLEISQGGASFKATAAQVVEGSGLGLSAIADNRVLANVSGSSAVPTATSMSTLLDETIGSTQGQILYRNSTVWTPLAPGTAGQVLTTGGAGANPSWAAAGSAPYSSSTAFTFSGGATTRCSNVTDCYVAVEAMPTLVDGTTYRFVFKYATDMSKSVGLLLDNGTSGYMVIYVPAGPGMQVYKCLAGTNTQLGNQDPTTITAVASKGYLTMTFVVGGSSGNTIAGQYNGSGGVGGMEGTLNMTSGTWVLSFRGAALADAVSCTLYTAPIW